MTTKTRHFYWNHLNKNMFTWLGRCVFSGKLWTTISEWGFPLYWMDSFHIHFHFHFSFAITQTCFKRPNSKTIMDSSQFGHFILWKRLDYKILNMVLVRLDAVLVELFVTGIGWIALRVEWFPVISVSPILILVDYSLKISCDLTVFRPI